MLKILDLIRDDETKSGRVSIRYRNPIEIFT